MLVNKIGRNTKPEYKKTVARVVKIQGTPGKYSGTQKARIEQALYEMTRR